jgi:hypothetical protein
MFKRTLKLLTEKQFHNTTEPKADIPKKLLDFYTPNNHIVDKVRIPYELRGEYLPRRKINPFRKQPLNVIYDHNDFAKFVLPSKRDSYYGGI